MPLGPAVSFPLAIGVDAAAIAVLLTFAAAIVGVVVWRIVSHPDGWRPGLLTVGLRGYTALFFRQHVAHESTVPGSGGALVVANHRSPTDPLIMHAAASFQAEGRRHRIVEWLTAREYSEVSGPIGWICRVARSIPVDRGGNDMTAVKAAMRRLKDGHIVGIFPEGKINTGRGLLEFNPGLAFIATRAQVPVVPCYIDGAPGGSSMVEPFLTPARVRVRFGEPLDFSHLRRPTAKQREEITLAIRRAIEALMPEDERDPPPAATELSVVDPTAA